MSEEYKRWEAATDATASTPQETADASPPPLTARMTAADGTRADVTDFEHPLAAFIESQEANIAYRAYFDVVPAVVATTPSSPSVPAACQSSSSCRPSTGG